VYSMSEEDLVKRARENPKEVFNGTFGGWAVVRIKTYEDDAVCKKPSRKHRKGHS
jgi:hypothetical protein